MAVARTPRPRWIDEGLRALAAGGPDSVQIAYLRTLLGTVCDDEEELEARCLIAFSVAIADHLIAADHGTRSRTDVREVIRRRLFAR